MALTIALLSPLIEANETNNSQASIEKKTSQDFIITQIASEPTQNELHQHKNHSNKESEKSTNKISTDLNNIKNQGLKDTTLLEKKVLTEGTTEAYGLKKFPGAVTPEKAGFRLHCRVSHVSYDDSIIHPNEKGKAHLHMFVGNTSTDENSTNDTILSENGNSTCEGGTTNKSAYWSPAVLDKDREFVTPIIAKVYYKTRYDRNKLNILPNNYQVIGSQKIPGCGDRGLNCARTHADPKTGNLKVNINFPNCLKVDSNGQPILQSKENDHAVMGFKSCPEDYPYRIPTPSLNFDYGIKYNSDWVLSSDIMDPENPKPKGSTIHGDVISSWPEEARKFMLDCNKKALNCGAVHREGNDYNTEGELVYEFSKYIGDQTPFEKLPAVATDHSMHDLNDSAQSYIPKVEDTIPDPNLDPEIKKQLQNDEPDIEDTEEKQAMENLSEEDQELMDLLKEIRTSINKLNDTLDKIQNSINKLFR